MKFLIIFFLTSPPYYLQSQIAFQETFGGSMDDEGNALIRSSDGDYLLAGYSPGFGAGSGDIYVIRTDSNGILKWNRTYGSVFPDWGSGIVACPDGGFVVAGTTSLGTGSYDACLLRANASGNIIWSFSYGSTDEEITYGFRKTSDGGYILSGNLGNMFGTYDGFLVRTDSNGTALWMKVYSGPNVNTSEQFYSVLENSDGGFFAFGLSYDITGDFYILRTTKTGDVLWARTIDSNGGEEYGYCAQLTSDGGIILGGELSVTLTNSDQILIKLDSTGALSWSQSYGSSTEENLRSIITTTDDGFLTLGSTNGMGAGSFDLYLVKTDNDGILQWSVRYGDTGGDTGMDIIPANDGGYVLLGYTQSFTSGNSEYYFIKTDSSGMSGCYESFVASQQGNINVQIVNQPVNVAQNFIQNSGINITYNPASSNTGLCGIVTSYTEKKILQHAFQLSHNVSEKILTVSAQSGQKIMNLSLFNCLGAEIYKQEMIDRNTFKLTTAGWAPAIYFVQIITDDKKVLWKKFYVLQK